MVFRGRNSTAFFRSSVKGGIPPGVTNEKATGAGMYAIFSQRNKVLAFRRPTRLVCDLLLFLNVRREQPASVRFYCEFYAFAERYSNIWLVSGKDVAILGWLFEPFRTKQLANSNAFNNGDNVILFLSSRTSLWRQAHGNC